VSHDEIVYNANIVAQTELLRLSLSFKTPITEILAGRLLVKACIKKGTCNFNTLIRPSYEYSAKKSIFRAMSFPRFDCYRHCNCSAIDDTISLYNVLTCKVKRVLISVMQLMFTSF